MVKIVVLLKTVKNVWVKMINCELFHAPVRRVLPCRISG